MTTIRPGSSPTARSGAAPELQRPKLNEWTPADGTRLPRGVTELAKQHGLDRADVMLVGPGEFLLGPRAGGDGLHVFKEDPDDFAAPFLAEVGKVSALGGFEATPASAPPPPPAADLPPAGLASVIGDASLRDVTVPRAMTGGIAAQLMSRGLRGGSAALFSDLPKTTQAEVRAFIKGHNEQQAMSMSPEPIEFARAQRREDGYDVTFRVRTFSGAEKGELTKTFGGPAVSAPPTADVGAAVTDLAQLPPAVRTAIEDRIERLNDISGMSMSPVEHAFGSASPRDDGSWAVSLATTTLFGGEGTVDMALGADGRWS